MLFQAQQNIRQFLLQRGVQAKLGISSGILSQIAVIISAKSRFISQNQEQKNIDLYLFLLPKNRQTLQAKMNLNVACGYLCLSMQFTNCNSSSKKNLRLEWYWGSPCENVTANSGLRVLTGDLIKSSACIGLEILHCFYTSRIPLPALFEFLLIYFTVRAK